MPEVRSRFGAELRAKGRERRRNCTGAQEHVAGRVELGLGGAARVGGAALPGPFDKGGGYPGAAIVADRLDGDPKRLTSDDAAHMDLIMSNPEIHSHCDPPDRLRAANRLMDFSVFLMARNDLTHEICTLRHFAYRQIAEVRFTDANGRTQEDLNEGGKGHKLLGDQVGTITAQGRVLPSYNGTGEGPRAPQLGGELANTINDPPFFVEKKECL